MSQSSASVSSGIEPIELIASTTNSLSADFTTCAMAGRSFVVPVDVSLWVTRTEVMSGCCFSAAATAVASAASP